MLKNASFLAIVAVYTAENEPPKVLKMPKQIKFKKPQLIDENISAKALASKPVNNLGS